MAEAITIALLLEAKDRASEWIDRVDEKISAMTEKAKASSEEMSAASDKVASSMERVSATADAQTGALDKVSASADTMSASLEKIAGTADADTTSTDALAASLDRTTAAMDRTAGAADRAGAAQEEMGAKSEESGSKLGGLGGVAKVALAAVVGMGVMGVKSALAYQQGLATLAGHAGITIAAATKIGNAFLGTAGTTTFSAKQMLDAFGPVSGEFSNAEGHALNASQALKVMHASMDLAEASGENLTSTTKTLADVMLPFHINTKQAANAGNVLWNTSRLLGVKVTDLGTQFQRLTPYVAGSGMSLQQMSGLMVELSHSLGSGRMATRQAGRAIQQLIDPSTTANKALAAMGVQLFNANGKFIGMPAAINALHSGLSKLPGATGAFAAQERLLGLQTQLATTNTIFRIT